MPTAEVVLALLGQERGPTLLRHMHVKRGPTPAGWTSSIRAIASRALVGTSSRHPPAPRRRRARATDVWSARRRLRSAAILASSQSSSAQTAAKGSAAFIESASGTDMSCRIRYSS